MSKGMWESPEAGLKDGQQENCDMMEIDGTTEEDGKAEKNFFLVFRLHPLLTSFTNYNPPPSIHPVYVLTS